MLGNSNWLVSPTLSLLLWSLGENKQTKNPPWNKTTKNNPQPSNWKTKYSSRSGIVSSVQHYYTLAYKQGKVQWSEFSSLWFSAKHFCYCYCPCFFERYLKEAKIVSHKTSRHKYRCICICTNYVFFTKDLIINNQKIDCDQYYLWLNLISCSFNSVIDYLGMTHYL